ncbi:SusC/RagA family TonB-linked outer membrane protein [Chitinophaga polysaccharea]|uniref:SusC/RagA family TonB-linked outer membrane protein n=1 Tax=Chitinophaga polysaccharea TaxID=1293035 RepID=UPI0014554BC7|nr:SusC/RagA family TonB-linked outer membrane protein [Chitinophaga polysaccharea]NLR59337.1 SusC/RagA family TonB-linked outer membrane protein [Chitinophaga polysaccharea]
MRENKRLSPICRRTKTIWLLLFLQLYTGSIWAQNAHPAAIGIIKNDKNERLPNVMVRVANVDNVILASTITNDKGIFTFAKLPAGGPYHFILSQMGYVTDTLHGYTITDSSKLSLAVTLKKKVEELEQVLVTALGIKREKKALGYSVEELAGKEFNRVNQENFLNAISGKVAGVTINSTGGPGSSVSMIIRGTTSLSSDNQPLFVVDGVPLANTINNISKIGKDNMVDYGNAISDINMDNIESVTILKGPSAAALYGSRAGNGVVLITTKTGKKVDRTTVSASINTVFDKPYKFLKWQHKFGSGQLSGIPVSRSGNLLTNPFGTIISENVDGTFGAELDMGYEEVQWNSPLDKNGKRIPMPLVSHKDNVKNFVNTGITTTTNVSLANNNNKIAYRLAYVNMNNKGIIPNTDLFKNALNLNSSLQVNSKFSVSANVDFSRTNSNNRPAGDRGANPLQAVYSISPHIDVRDLKDYWMPGQEGLQQRTQYNGVFNNPYFLAYEVKNGFVRDRVFGNVRADWKILPFLSFMARYALDTYNEKRETQIAASYLSNPGGAYGIININSYERNIDVLLTYKKDIGDVDFTLSAGGNKRYQTGKNITTATKDGTGLITPGVYTIQNIAPQNLDYNSTRYEKGVNSVYAMLNVGYKGMAYLDLTGRNDWSSTLPEAAAYFYPSASLSLLVNEMMHITSDNINMIKLRGGAAQVGNDAAPYQLLGTLYNAGAWGNIPRQSTSGTLLNPFLKPEIATSYEGGIDVNLFRNRLRMAATWYMVENKNQIFSPKTPPSSGYSSRNINAGLLRSRGIELTLGGTPVDRKNWRWDVNVNFTRNRTKIISLPNDLPYYTLWEEGKGGAWTYVGEDIGDIYDAQLVTVTDKSSPYYGYPILDNTGKWQSIDAINTRNKIGNFNPKFIMGLQTAISYKNFTLSMTLDWRNGGDFVSQTYRYGEEHGNSQLFLDKLTNPGNMKGQELRDYLVSHQDQLVIPSGNKFPLVGGPTPEYNSFPFSYGPYVLPYGGVFIPGVRAKGYDANGNPTGYIENLGNDGTVTLPYAASTAWSFTRAFLFPASYLKLREVSLSYELPKRWIASAKLQNAALSIYSRNIILWTAAKIGIDPENAYQPSTTVQGSGMQFMQGIERYNVTPWSIPMGAKLNVTF